MKLNKKTLLLIVLCLSTVMLLCACHSERADQVDYRIKAMVKKGVSFKMESELIDLEEQVALLTDWERNAMEYYDDLVKYRADYDKFVQDKIVDLQAKLDALPALDQIRVASEKDINAAKSAYDSASDYVRSQVTGAEKLSAAVTKLEQVLKDAWQPCENCGGDGKTVCKLCNGKGSRQVNHTTPNGKTWRVSQECKTTSTCSACKGKGGVYVED